MASSYPILDGPTWLTRGRRDWFRKRWQKTASTFLRSYPLMQSPWTVGDAAEVVVALRLVPRGLLPDKTTSVGSSHAAFLVRQTTTPARGPFVARSHELGSHGFLGCYDDNVGGQRTLGGSYYRDTANMNASACIAFCSKKGAVYAGTEYAVECYCGNTLAAATTLQADSSCNMGCAYNGSEACGGPNMISIYYANTPAPLGPFTNPGPDGWASQGCWTDGGQRTLSYSVDVEGGGSNMTVAGCTSACNAAGYGLAGVEYAGEW
ncbi:hypothetical protein LTR53_000437 [Teratosphaeriaceae sp. CCFEE 6253]|nr:hypothetical protein LTR53_000437 [Teratosphaeriaceae sp. CCFEE 6253]